MSGEHVEVVGLSKLARSLKKMDAGLVGATRAIGLRAAEIVAADARDRAPRVSGRLAGTIRAGATRTGAKIRVGGKQVPYAAPVHWGWPSRGIAPQPFLYEALDAKREEVIRLYDEGIADLEREAFL